MCRDLSSETSWESCNSNFYPSLPESVIEDFVFLLHLLSQSLQSFSLSPSSNPYQRSRIFAGFPEMPLGQRAGDKGDSRYCGV
ncbi:Protein arginine N-methyltransferase 5 [Platanthera zijinensis]|uniref:Protein arginine N-methyltransferase 5 n=1 Tax=Platanthera zijinensis TaxID=2320716 RepID=A0AAP0BYZ2_9ASPA